MATGVLVVGINKATRLLTYIVGTSKTYTATIRLGQTTGQISDSIFSTYLVPFEAASVLLLAALIGAIVLARRD